MNRYKRILISFLLVIISITIIACENVSKTEENTKIESDESIEVPQATEIPETEESVPVLGIIKVHFIDVDQGDGILIESEGNYMLVDGGENDQEENLLSYLENQGVTKLDYVIGTHPHSDHIGGLDKVIDNFEVDKVILPDKEHLTFTFEEVLDSIENKGLKITKAIVGETYSFGPGEFTVIGPNGDYGNELNNWSVGIKLTFGDNSFLMYGDGEIEAEYDMIDNGIDLSADVLKVSHHGSSTSSSEAILQAVLPRYGVISVGINNSYGHPHDEILKKLEAREVEVHRTDEKGTIIAIGDGKNISWEFEKNHSQNKDTISQNDNEATHNYVGNGNSKKFHYPDCSSVSSMNETNKIDLTGTRSEAISKGYDPCGICNP